MSGGVNSGSVYGMRGGRGYYSRGRGGRGEERNFQLAVCTCANFSYVMYVALA